MGCRADREERGVSYCLCTHYHYVWHCYSRGQYFLPYVFWPSGIAGAYVVDDYGTLVRVGP